MRPHHDTRCTRKIRFRVIKTGTLGTVMSVWMSIEIFNGAYAAQLWADNHVDSFIEAAIVHGAIDWDRKKTAWGVAIEVEFESEAAWKQFRTAEAVRTLLDNAPDPRNGVLIYRGRSLDGGSTARRPKKPKSGAGGAALGLPYVTAPFVEPLAALFSDSTVDRRVLTHTR
jgi:hypothetical protein